MKLDINQRRAGVFVPVFALRTETDLGIGDTGSLRKMIDWCREMDFSILQILPINETSEDNSPYNAISSLALEPTTLEISPELIPGLTSTDMKKLATATLLKKLRNGHVQYKAVKKLKRDLIECAFKKFNDPKKAKTFADAKKEFEAFKSFAKGLGEYAFFRALVDQYGHPNWEAWSKDHKTFAAAKQWFADLSEAKQAAFTKKIEFFSYVQWLLDRQWKGVREYGESKGVYLMGDIPFGVSRCSADVWIHPNLFNLDWSAGAPPEGWFKGDPFTEKWGQNWGVPVYNWDAMKKDNYAWWRRRIQATARYFKLFRIDHILGFYRIFAFPWQPRDNHLYTNMDSKKVEAKLGALPQFIPGDDKVPEEAKINQEQGEMLLKMVLDAAGDATVVGEDLGAVPDYARPSLEKLGISGYKVPMFEREYGTDEYRNPEQYPVLSVATLSTHDHPTMLGFWESWWNKFEEMERRRANGTLDKEFEQDATRTSWEIYRTQRFAWIDDRTMIRNYEPQVREAILRRMFKSSSWFALLMITDVFGLKLRFNVPGPVADSNWSERLPFTMTEMFNAPALEPVRAFTKWAIQDSDRAR